MIHATAIFANYLRIRDRTEEPGWAGIESISAGVNFKFAPQTDVGIIPEAVLIKIRPYMVSNEDRTAVGFAVMELERA